ncbi:MAG: hypothetical protein CM1200mP30_23080 [Pseudomonadota bacterium]|nr:MAG: hypothetical protein CM1200mP30_23080 [Pseudomonadota bacterium]
MGTEFENLSARFLIQSRSSLLKQIKIIFKTSNPIQMKLKEFQEKVEKFHLEDETGGSIKAI